MEVHLARVAQREHRRIDVDLHRARGAVLRQELRPWEAGADHQQGVAAVHQVGARPRAEQADRAGDEGQVVGQEPILPSKRLGDAGAQRLRDLDDLVGSLGRARADQDRDLLAGIEHVRRSAAGPLGRDDRRAANSRVRTA